MWGCPSISWKATGDNPNMFWGWLLGAWRKMMAYSK